MIQPGVPTDRSAWPENLLEHLKRFRQGDLIASFPALYLGDPSVAVHAQTAAYAGADPGVIEFEPFPFGMILTQTCDIREEDSRKPSRPWVHIAPVYDGAAKYRPDPESPRERSILGSNIREMLVEGGGPQYLLYLPDFAPEPGLWVADLRLVVAADKGWLAGRDPISAFASETDRRTVGHRLAMLQIRPAFDGRFETAVRRPLIQALRALDPGSDLHRAIYREVHQFAVRSDDNVEMERAQVWILSYEPLSAPVRRWLVEREEQWQTLASEAGLVLLPSQYTDLRSMTAEEYIDLTMMPLSYLSPDPPWYGAEH